MNPMSTTPSRAPRPLPIRLAPVLLLLTALTLASCAKKDGENFAGVDGEYDYVSGTPLPERIDGANFLGGNVNRTQFPPIYFGFDSYTISGAETGKLQTVANALKSSGSDVIIAGFTDERGTEEYNRALGERRAQAVRQYLISQGVNAGTLQTVSFGEEMPANPGSGEAAWSQNRRAEFGVVQ